MSGPEYVQSRTLDGIMSLMIEGRLKMKIRTIDRRDPNILSLPNKTCLSPDETDRKLCRFGISRRIAYESTLRVRILSLNTSPEYFY